MNQNNQYGHKRTHVYKCLIVSSDGEERSANLTPHLWGQRKRKVKSRAGNAPAALALLQTGGENIHFNLYQGSHRIAVLSQFTSAFSSNTDVFTTELNRKSPLQFGLPMQTSILRRTLYCILFYALGEKITQCDTHKKKKNFFKGAYVICAAGDIQ